jgi:hypothetical protein
MLENKGQAVGRDNLVAFDVSGALLQSAQHGQGVGGAGKAEPGDGAAADRRYQPQRCGGDNAQRPFRTDQQLVEIVAAIVFLEARKPVVDGAVGQHRFHALHQRAHGPEAQHLGAAGVGGDEAADGAAAARAQGQRETPADLVRRGVQIGEDHPSLGDGHAGLSVQHADFGHPPQRQEQRRAIFRRRRARDHAGIAALRHQRHAKLGCQGDNCRDFLGRGR